MAQQKNKNRLAIGLLDSQTIFGIFWGWNCALYVT